MDFSINHHLKDNLDTAKVLIRKDWDFLFLVDGVEGSGKSVLSFQCAKYCDPTFCIERVTFTPKEFREAILKANKYEAVVFDEAFRGLSSRATMTQINRLIVSMLAEIRQKNLFVFIVMPTFFDLDKNVALWRSRALLHVYTGENFERGYFAFFNRNKKTELYVNGKKYYSYSKPKSNFTGRFTNHYPIDEGQYRRKKYHSLKGYSSDEEEKQAEKLATTIFFERLVRVGDRITVDVKCELLQITKPTWYKWLREFEENAKEEEISQNSILEVGK